MIKVLNKIENYLLFILVFATPLFVAGIAQNPFVVPKVTLILVGLSVIVVFKLIKLMFEGKIRFSAGNFDLAVFLFTLSYIVATILRTPNKMEALLLPGSTTAVVLAALLYFVVNQIGTSAKKNLQSVLILSGATYSLLIVLAFSGIFEKVAFLPAFLRAKTFTPDGGYLPSAIFLSALIPLAIGLSIQEKEIVKKVLYILGIGFVVFGLFISVFNLLPGKPTSPKFLSQSASWNIAVDTLKESPLFGSGPGNYLTSFNRFRPISVNQTPIWNVKFATASNFIFTVLTEAGLLGFGSLVLLIYILITTIRKDIKERRVVNWGFAGISILVSVIVMFMFFLIFPATALLLLVFFMLLATASHTRELEFNLTATSSEERKSSKLPALILALPIFALLIWLNFRAYKVYAGEYKYVKSLEALSKNDAKGTLTLLNEAIKLNPKVDRYHATASRLSFLLANAIAAKGKDKVTDEDKKNITSLIQSSIQEGKNTVALNPYRAGNWEVLGSTYRAISPLAKDADNFAIQSYRNAVILDPLNPALRVTLGGLYYAKKDYDNAVRIFELAASTKLDYANAYYNLAFAYKEKGELQKAIDSMSKVLSLVDKNTKDYDAAMKALEDMQAKQKQVTKASGENLSAPEEQKNALEPKLDLPQGANPPESPVEATPTPTPEANPSISVSPTPTTLP